MEKAHKIAIKKNVLMIGMGLTFFDYLELITVAAGGQYIWKRQELIYKPSGKEPIIYATSRKGIPHQARGINQKSPKERWQPQFITASYAKKLIAQKHIEKCQISFGQHLWSMITREVELVYTLAQIKEHNIKNISLYDVYKVLLAKNMDNYFSFREYIGLEYKGFPWDYILNPFISTEGVGSIDAYQERVIAYLENDIKVAQKGNKSNPLKSALDVLRDIRNEIRLATQQQVLEGWSYQDELAKFYTPLNAFLSIGPPLYRIEQLNAAIKSGIVKVLPKGVFLSPDQKHQSAMITCHHFLGETVAVDAVIEARQQQNSFEKTTDPLLQHLLKTGLTTIHYFKNTFNPSGSITVNESNFKIINSLGDENQDIFSYGITMEGLSWGTAATIRPFVNSVIFQEADIVAQQIICTNELDEHSSTKKCEKANCI